MRTAVSCASFPVFPPVRRGQAAAGDDPGIGAGVAGGMGLGVGLGVAGAGVGVGGREADGAGGAGVGDGRPSGIAHPAVRTATDRRIRA